MKEQLEKIRSEALAALNEAKDSAELDALRVAGFSAAEIPGRWGPTVSIRETK